MSELVRRGDVFMANLVPTIGVEIKKKRPVIVVSNDTINQFSRLVIVVPLTTNIFRLSPSHVLIPKGEGGLGQDSKALIELADQDVLDVSRSRIVEQEVLDMIDAPTTR
jgi:mRNA interferase MazF